MKCMKPGNARRQGCGYERSTSARRATPFQLGPAWAGSGESDTNEETLPPTTHKHTTCLLGARLRGTQSSPRLPKAQKRLSASACHVSVLADSPERCATTPRPPKAPDSGSSNVVFERTTSSHVCTIQFQSPAVFGDLFYLRLLLHKVCVCVCSFLHCMHCGQSHLTQVFLTPNMKHFSMPKEEH